MMPNSTAIFTSERLAFRPWQQSDLDAMAAINANPKVMAHFPDTQNKTQTQGFIDRMQEEYRLKGHCYFAVELIKTNEFIGFIGLSTQTYAASFTPCIDIGWRLDEKHWNNGYAQEGAKRCLAFGFDTLKLVDIYAICPKSNKASEHVMKRIGMTFYTNFKHPLLESSPHLQDCFVYKSSNPLNI
ncbi:MAG: GNAT family N-acetyltransferase [Bacteroidetes bacterium MedPE-SWsnd-G2]|nr:MAG: GNAT family N-acetyltransferase [Bacteroidetes bacterium MedPE-SWsnd-G2]